MVSPLNLVQMVVGVFGELLRLAMRWLIAVLLRGMLLVQVCVLLRGLMRWMVCGQVRWPVC